MRNAISREHFSQFILLVICYLGRIYENMRNKYFISIAGKRLGDAIFSILIFPFSFAS